MTDRHIVAMGGGGFSDDDPRLGRYVVDLAGKPNVTTARRTDFNETALSVRVGRIWSASVGRTSMCAWW